MFKCGEHIARKMTKQQQCKYKEDQQQDDKFVRILMYSCNGHYLLNFLHVNCLHAIYFSIVLVATYVAMSCTFAQKLLYIEKL